MKKTVWMLLIGGFLFAACEGPAGSPGPAGPQGPAGPPGSGEGVNLVNEVFEVQFDFTAGNAFFQGFELNPAIGANDVVLVFLLWEFTDQLDIWRPLPQTVFLDEGLLQYNYDFTTVDFGIFLESNFNLATLGPTFTDEQVFRVMLVQGSELATQPDLSNYHEVMELIGKTEDDVRKFRMK